MKFQAAALVIDESAIAVMLCTATTLLYEEYFEKEVLMLITITSTSYEIKLHHCLWAGYS